MPARDGQALLGNCLDAAARRPLVRALPVHVIVMTDACRDATAAVAGSGADMVELNAATSGRLAPPAATTRSPLPRPETCPSRCLWLAHTDAGFLVPPRWFTISSTSRNPARHAVGGSFYVTDWTSPPGIAEIFQRSYRADCQAPRRPHVRDASLTVRPDGYHAAGGFRPRPGARTGPWSPRTNASGARSNTPATTPLPRPRVVIGAPAASWL
ncbi:hypothetical protein ACFXI6_50085 [Streptomyces mirabilis]|uniref:hypothetical protein n=1 Tax=Streptomyces mirabilis TaxID=68239 RepID=UPI003674E6B5